VVSSLDDATPAPADRLGQIGIDVGSPESSMGVMPNAGGLSPLFSAT
jgi:hypothetical protein